MGAFREIMVAFDDEIKKAMEQNMDGVSVKERAIPKDEVNHPDHYTNRGMECIEEMVLVFGISAVMDFCKCNIWKYRYRQDSKGSSEKDAAKADWYMKKYAELKERLKEENDYYTYKIQ